MAKGDITFPSRIALIFEGVIATEKSMQIELYQVTPVEKYGGEEEEVTLCEAIVKGTGTFLILISK